MGAEQMDVILTDVRRNFPTGPPSSDDMASRLLNKTRYFPPALQERLIDLLAATSAVNQRSMNGYTQGMDGVMAYFLTLGASDELAYHLFQQLVHNNRYCMSKVWGRALPFVHTTLRFLWSKHPKAGKLAGKIA